MNFSCRHLSLNKKTKLYGLPHCRDRETKPLCGSGWEEMKVDDVVKLLRYTYQQNIDRLGLLTSLQKAVLKSVGDGTDDKFNELKALLTHVIIMQTKLNEREIGLVELVERVAEFGSLNNVKVEGVLDSRAKREHNE